MNRGQFTYGASYDNDNDPDYIYYNCSIINNDSRAFDLGPDPAVRFIETRDVPILSDASKYNFSIVRFTMNGPNKDLPLFIPVIRTGAANPGNNVNLTIYSVSLELRVRYTRSASVYENTFTTTQPLIWTTETYDTNLAPVPAPSTCQTGQDISTRYYWAYTYSHWMSIFRTASIAAIADLQTQFNLWWVAQAIPGSPPAIRTKAPEFSWNPNTSLFTLYCDAYSFGDPLCASAYQQGLPGHEDWADNEERADIFFNNNLFGMFSNFDNEYLNNGEFTNRIIVPNINGQNLVSLQDPITGLTYTYWIVQQDFESTSTLWSPIESITFTSALLPLVFEQQADPINFGEGNDNGFASGRPAFAPIITDVALTNENANSYRTFIIYSPQAEYRLASFHRSKQPINNIDVQVFWKNRLDGKLYPVQMFNGSSVSIKMMFRRKGSSDHPEKV